MENQNYEVLDPQQNQTGRNPIHDGIWVILVFTSMIAIAIGGWDTRTDKLNNPEISNFIDLDELARIQANPTLADKEKLQNILSSLPDGHPMKEGVVEIFCRHFDSAICRGHKSQKKKNSDNLERKRRLEAEIDATSDDLYRYKLIEKLCSEFHSDLCLELEDLDADGGDGAICHPNKNSDKLLAIAKFSNEEVEKFIPDHVFENQISKDGLDQMIWYMHTSYFDDSAFEDLWDNGIFSVRHLLRVGKKNVDNILKKRVDRKDTDNFVLSTFENHPEVIKLWNK